MAIERTDGPFLTGDHEFHYIDSDLWVLPETSYFVHYSTNKIVTYELEQTKEQIVAMRKKPFEVYKRITNRLRDIYPKKIYPTVKKLPFGQKFISRVFTQSKLIPGAEIYETISKTKTASYRFVKLEWQISGAASQAELHNFNELQKAEAIIPGISEVIPVLQLHKTKIRREKDPANLIKKNHLYANSATDEVLQNLTSPTKEQSRTFKKKRKRRRKSKKK